MSNTSERTTCRNYPRKVREIDGRLVEAEVLWEQVQDRTIYPFDIPSIASLKTLGLDRAVTYLVGENGSGKSTLLEAIAVGAGLNPEGGSRNLRFATNSTHSSLHEHLLLSWRGRPKRAFFLRAESFYNLASTYKEVFEDVPDMATLHDRSHGESFLYAVQKHSGPRGLYLLDEPESALSVRGQLALLRQIHDGVAEASQFIISTHSPILLAYPNAGIFQMTDEGPVPIEYRDTDQFQLTQAFLESPHQFFRYLFDDN
jgi:predicted ATPase